MAEKISLIKSVQGEIKVATSEMLIFTKKGVKVKKHSNSTFHENLLQLRSLNRNWLSHN